ncbi:MAG: hypothetical protein ACI4TH_06885 [Candidatus Ornithomonoglobus sp.]
MKLFKKKQKSEPVPQGYTIGDIRTESSICTGETTIGFYDAHERRLMYAELVKSDEDITAYYAKYGAERP